MPVMMLMFIGLLLRLFSLIIWIIGLKAREHLMSQLTKVKKTKFTKQNPIPKI